MYGSGVRACEISARRVKEKKSQAATSCRALALSFACSENTSESQTTGTDCWTTGGQASKCVESFHSLSGRGLSLYHVWAHFPFSLGHPLLFMCARPTKHTRTLSLFLEKLLKKMCKITVDLMSCPRGPCEMNASAPRDRALQKKEKSASMSAMTIPPCTCFPPITQVSLESLKRL